MLKIKISDNISEINVGDTNKKSTNNSQQRKNKKLLYFRIYLGIGTKGMAVPKAMSRCYFLSEIW